MPTQRVDGAHTRPVHPPPARGLTRRQQRTLGRDGETRIAELQATLATLRGAGGRFELVPAHSGATVLRTARFA